MPDPYTRPTALRAARLTRPETRRRGWTRPHRGVLTWGALDLAAPLTRIQAAAEAEPDVPLGTWAAAYLHGATALDGTELDGQSHQPVVFCPGATGRRRPRPGLVPLRSTVAADDVIDVRGIPVTSPLRTAFDLGRTAPDLDTAVADLDALLRATGLPVVALAEYTRQRPRWKGVPLLRAALPLLDPRARSRPESRMRVVWVRDAGLPRPEVNVPVHGLPDGWLLGLPDLLDPATGLVGEYDGAGHRTPEQHGADNIREETFERHGLTVVRAVWRDVLTRNGLARRLRSGYEEARHARRRAWYVPPSRRGQATAIAAFRPTRRAACPAERREGSSRDGANTG